MCTCRYSHVTGYVAVRSSGAGTEEPSLPPELTAEIAQLGRQELLSRLQTEARAAVGEWPCDAQIKTLPPAVQDLLADNLCLVMLAVQADSWTDRALTSYTRELAWAAVGLHATAAALGAKGPGNTGGIPDRCVDCDAKDAACKRYQATRRLADLMLCLRHGVRCVICEGRNLGLSQG